jgi:hypothetical protein
MKKSLLFLMLLLAGISLTTFGHLNSNIDPRTEQAFKNEFSGAVNVTWAKAGNFSKASFTWADHQTVAYFNAEAELVGCIRGLFFNQLPLTVIRSVERNFKNADILEIREITNKEGTIYTIVLENKNKEYKIRLNNLGEILETEKIIK